MALTNVDPLIPAAERESIANGVTCFKDEGQIFKKMNGTIYFFRVFFKQVSRTNGIHK